MSYIGIMRQVAINASIEPPVTTSATDADQQKIGEFINETGIEVARRVDWSALGRKQTISGTGTPQTYMVNPDYERFSPGAVVVSDGTALRGSLSDDEWGMLQAKEGRPRYFYLSKATIPVAPFFTTSVQLYPYMAAGRTAEFRYQSKNWVVKADGQRLGAMQNDTDATPLPEDAIAAGAFWRWRRHVGKDFSDQLAEFEAILADRARHDGGVRFP